MRKYIFLTVMICGLVLNSQAQIGYGTNSPDPRAVIELNSDNKAFYLPRLTTAQLNAQVGWKAGMVVYNTDSNCVLFRGEAAWNCLKFGAEFELVDADGDTKVQVEETPDDDVIRFDVAGTEGMTLSNGNTTFQYVEPVSNTPFTAYSLRRVVSGYSGPAIRIRRPDNTEKDIYFTQSNELDLASITSFVGSDDAFVTTWYDQAGSNDLTQTDGNKQPRIAIAGAVQTTDNGKPAIDFASTNFLTVQSSDALQSSSQLSLLAIAEFNSGNAWMLIASQWIAYPENSVQRTHFSFKRNTGLTPTLYAGTLAAQSGSAVTQGATTAVGYAMGSSGAFIGVNGTQTSITGVSMPDGSGDYLVVGDNRTNYFIGKQSELLFYTSTLASADYTAIEDNQENYWISGSTTLLTSSGVEAQINGNAQITGILYDSNGNPGLPGQVLSTSAVGTHWTDLPESGAEEPWFGVDNNAAATDNTEDMYVMGKVGIGTSSFTQQLEVDGNAIIGSGANGLQVGFVGHNNLPGIANKDIANTAGNYALVQYSNGQTLLNSSSGQPLRFNIGNSEEMRVHSDGNVGINYSAPAYKLDVNGTFRNTGASLLTVMGGSDDMTATPARGICMWTNTDNNWGIYMSRSGAGRAMGGGTAPDGTSFNSYALRLRVDNNSNRGIIFENGSDLELMSVRGNDGLIHSKYIQDNFNRTNLNGSLMVADTNGYITGTTDFYRIASITYVYQDTIDLGKVYAYADLKGSISGLQCVATYSNSFHLSFLPSAGFSLVRSLGGSGGWVFSGTGTTSDPYKATSPRLVSSTCVNNSSEFIVFYVDPSDSNLKVTSTQSTYNSRFHRLIIETY